LQLYVLDDNSTVVLSETLTVEPDSTGVIEDVFDRPGPYTILASTNDTTTASTWDEGQRYYGTGGAVWNVVILPSGQLKNSRVEMA
jgi:hypothetical protein